MKSEAEQTRKIEMWEILWLLRKDRNRANAVENAGLTQEANYDIIK